MANFANVPDLTTWVQQNPAITFDSSLVEVLRKHQALWRNNTPVILKLSDLQTQQKMTIFWQICEHDGKSDKSFIDWITQVEKIVHLTQHGSSTYTAAISFTVYEFNSFIQLFLYILHLYTGFLLSYTPEIYLDNVLQGSIQDF